jgi:hypothetical protein
MHPVWGQIPVATTIVSRQYNQLILIVGNNPQLNTQILQNFAATYRVSPINLTIEIIHKMNTTEYSLQDIITNLIAERATTPLLIDAIDVLFDKCINKTINPYLLLRNLSRQRIVVATWRGNHVHQSITYATSGHSEYYVYHDVDTIILDAN